MAQNMARWMALAWCAAVAGSAGAQESTRNLSGASANLPLSGTISLGVGSSGGLLYDRYFYGNFRVDTLSWTSEINANSTGAWRREMFTGVTAPGFSQQSVRLDADPTANSTWSGYRAFNANTSPAGNPGSNGGSAASYFSGKRASGLWRFRFFSSASYTGAPDLRNGVFTLNPQNVLLNSVSLGTINSGAFGSTITGDTTGAFSDTLGPTGRVFGNPIPVNTNDGYNAGDNVWTVSHAGGDLSIQLDHNAGYDLNLFLWGNTTATSLLGQTTGTDLSQTLTVTGLAAGTYYLAVDGVRGNSASTGGEGAYTLTVIPAPASAALLGLAGLAARRRRR
ncbi:MAG: hypothetical protein IBJ11_05660 [Phycisphaerales bacterium]|nr:hypothetical protein [Phycisphaerales bacterium]